MIFTLAIRTRFGLGRIRESGQVSFLYVRTGIRRETDIIPLWGKKQKNLVSIPASGPSNFGILSLAYTPLGQGFPACRIIITGPPNRPLKR